MNRGIIKMLISSMIGGLVVAVISLGLNPHQQTITQGNQSLDQTLFTNYVFDSTDFVVPEGLNFVFAAKSATPSVVHIKTFYENANSANSPFNRYLREHFGDHFSNPNPSQGQGSGIIMREDGYIVTNNHVIEDAVEIQVVLNDNRSYKAELIGSDPTTDIALIKINEKNLQSMSLGSSDNIQIGEWVLAIGNPFEFRSTVTAGIVSAKGRSINILRGKSNLSIESFIQTDAAVNPGNSGGALVNLKGQLVGMNTAIASPTGAFAGYSFAVPVSLVEKVVDDLAEFGTVQRGLLGITIRNVDAELANKENIDLVKGVFIQEVGYNSAASEAGLENGDIILAIDDKKVSSVAELQEQVGLNRPGDRIKITYIRDAETKQSYAVLQNNFGTTNVVEVNNSFKIEGATFQEIGSDMKKKLDIKSGIQITQLKSGSWREAGIKTGFIITKIDREPVIDIEQFIRLVKAVGNDGILIAGYYPNGEKAYYGVELP